MSTKYEKDALREERKEILESSLFGLRDRYASYPPDSESGRLVHAEFIYRQTLFQERATKAQERAADVQERAADAQERAADAQEGAAASAKKHTWIMTITVIVLAITALVNILIAVY